jgi:Helix-turn-helix domain
MLVPASDAGGLRTTEGRSSYAHTPPPGEGIRSWPSRAARPQRQGPHCDLRAGLERAEPPAAPQHRGPITRAFLDVLEALLWGFHNSRSGVCFPSYEAIAAKAECARSTVAEALKALEWAGVLTWHNRITRILVRERDLFGHCANRWRVIRISNAYVFSDPKPQHSGVSACKSENPIGTLNQEVLTLRAAPASNPNNPLERALRQLNAGIEERLLSNESSGQAGAQ